MILCSHFIFHLTNCSDLTIKTSFSTFLNSRYLLHWFLLLKITAVIGKKCINYAVNYERNNEISGIKRYEIIYKQQLDAREVGESHVLFTSLLYFYENDYRSRTKIVVSINNLLWITLSLQVLFMYTDTITTPLSEKLSEK